MRRKWKHASREGRNIGRKQERESERVSERKYKIVELLLSPARAKSRLVISRKAKYKVGERAGRGAGAGAGGVEAVKGL